MRGSAASTSQVELLGVQREERGFSQSVLPPKKPKREGQQDSAWETHKWKLRNQKLYSWRPILKERYALPLFLLVGLVFVPLGAVLVIFAESGPRFEEVVVKYTDCNSTIDPTISCREFINEADNLNKGLHCECVVEFEIAQDMDRNVMLYYGLTNYNQNHQKYMNSVDQNQLRGNDIQSPRDSCAPFTTAEDANQNLSLPIAPCGAIANSLFNDTFQLKFIARTNGSEVSVPIPLNRTGIAWRVFSDVEFRNPPGNGSLESRFAGTTKPPGWHKYVWELDPENPDNNGFQNEDLIVWMKPAVVDTFKKPHRRIQYDQIPFLKNLPSDTGLLKGTYELHVNYSYPVGDDQDKFIILGRSGAAGGFNSFLGTMYCVTGSLSLFTCLLMFLLHLKYSTTARRKELGGELRFTYNAEQLNLN